MTTSAQADFVACLNDPKGHVGELISNLGRLGPPPGIRGNFLLYLGGTHTSDIPGISAAGATPETRRLTPAMDAEILISGRCGPGKSLPVSPAGIVSPVVLTRAALNLLKIPITIVDCGTFHPPEVPHISLSNRPARCLSTGQAMDMDAVLNLFHAGLRIGEEASRRCDFLMLAECVPAGTTTALAVLKALGHTADRLLSGSMVQPNHDLQLKLVEEGLQLSHLTREAVLAEPLRTVAAMGDPMQATLAGTALGAAAKIPVVLSGGSQMLAIWALLSAIKVYRNIAVDFTNLAVITTKWVALDRRTGPVRLSAALGAGLAACSPNFHRSRHPGLRAYEQGHVKEGVGAGAAMAMASVIAGVSEAELIDAVDSTYDSLILDLVPPARLAAPCSPH